MPELPTSAGELPARCCAATIPRPRLARWAACIHFLGGDTGIGTAAVTRHLRLCGGDSPRMELDTAIAEHLAPARPDAP